jgi:acetolactate synthase I/III small subunit
MHHTLVALVEDKPGVLNRVASLFRRRAFNIESLTVGRTDVAGISRMTVVMDSDEVSADRVTAYLYKLVNVLQVEDLRDVPTVARDLALVKVAVAGHDRGQILRVVDETRAHIVDSGEQTMTLEITGEPPHVDKVIARLEPLGIIEMVRTGQVAMRRGDTALSAARYS